jgi:hypothetical protein
MAQQASFRNDVNAHFARLVHALRQKKIVHLFEHLLNTDHWPRVIH